jgi:rfaE bifunctional protein kinase chain/domain
MATKSKNKFDVITLENTYKKRNRFLQAIKKFAKLKILVIGDVGLDEYLDGEVRRISPEAPVPVVEIKKKELRVGLAANVAQNVVALGGECALVGIVGQDSAAKELSDLLNENGTSPRGLLKDDSRPTTRKVRVMSGQHHLVRVDFEERKYFPKTTLKKLLDLYLRQLKSSSAVVLQDYGKGLFSEKFCQDIIRAAKKMGKIVIVDPHRTTPIHYYRGATIIKPNRDEAFVLSGLNIDDLHLTETSIHQVAAAIAEQTKCEHVVITAGKKGTYLFSEFTESGAKTATEISTAPRQVFDVTGAGDTYVATLALSWMSGLTLDESCALANFAGGIVVGKIGCVPCSHKELAAACSGK